MKLHAAVFLLNVAMLLTAMPRWSSNAVTFVDTREYKVQVEPLIENLNHPWGITWLKKESLMLISERNDGLWLADLQSRQLKPLRGLRNDVRQAGQGGWLDLASDEQDRIYLSYARDLGNGRSATALLSFKIVQNGQNYQATEQKILFQAEPTLNSQIHYGAPLALTEKYIYLGLGERGQRQQAQSLKSSLGSIVRLNYQGQAAAANPFQAQEEVAEIYSYGHRNPQGLVWLPHEQLLFSSEHGPKGGDELNLIEVGVNYGWPIISHGKEYRSGKQVGLGTHKEGLAQPLRFWTPSPAFAGMDYYSSSYTSFPRWQRSLFITALAKKRLHRLELSTEQSILSEELIFLPKNERLRQVKIASDGFLYILTDSRNGRLLRLKPA